MNVIQADTFARGWVADWNRADIAAIMSHYAEDVTFTSPYVTKVTGQSTVHGKNALRQYWSTGLQKAKIFHTFKEVLVDGTANTIAIAYIAGINELRLEACEVMRFNPEQLVCSSAAYYGAALP